MNVTCPIGTPVPLTLLDYQERGRDFLAARDAALLADDPGLGKTCQAITAARMVKPRSMVVICPRTAIPNWHRELGRWWPEHVSDAIVHVMNYDRLSLDTPEASLFLGTEWDLVIADEAHRLKSPGARRTLTFYRGVIRLRKAREAGGRNPGKGIVWLLTGTPARNHPGELYTHLRALRPDLLQVRRGGRNVMLDTVAAFEDYYCDVNTDRFGHRVVKGANRARIGQLRTRLEHGGFLLRRRKADVMTSLPDMCIDTYPLSLAPADTARVRACLAEMGLGPGMPGDAILSKLRGQALSKNRRLLGVLKAPAVAGFVEEELAPPGKIIVFAMHRDVLRELEARLADYGPVLVMGGTRSPQNLVDRFQGDPKCRVFLGQIDACGEALNLTAASQVIFAEASWSHAANYQAMCRAHRYGSSETRALIVRFVNVPGSVDTIVQRTLARKARDMHDLFG